MEKAFFDEISGYYDEMIGFEAALERRTPLLKNFISEGMIYAADIGCGTGLDSIALYKAGLKVRAFDPSAGMIEQARNNAEKYEARVKFYVSPFHLIPDIYNSSFDFAVSLGNTVANITPAEINNSIRRLNEILKDGGRAVIQILNYDYLKEKNERIVNITKKDDICFVRFYDFFDSYINFNIVRFNINKTSDRQMDTTRLYPYTKDELVKILEENSFRNIEAFGSMKKDPFEKKSSADLVLTADK
jgi:glycine/sarcosine N-methyltransferase